MVSTPSRYFWMESGGKYDKKQDKWVIKTEGRKMVPEKGNLFQTKLGGFHATAVMLSFFGSRIEVC